MSYCRFSTDDFRSDVYVYDGGNIILMIASNKYEYGNIKLPDPINLSDNPTAWFERYQTVRKILDTLPRVPLDHPDAGKTFEYDSPGACADKLISLAAEGVYVPDNVIEALREEQEFLNDYD